MRRHAGALFDLANDPLILFDDELNVVDANDRAVETYGYERSALLDLTLEDLCDPGSSPPIAEMMERVKAEDGLVHMGVHRRRGGETFAVECSTRVLDVEGVTVVQMSVRDVGGRERDGTGPEPQPEDALRENEERYRSLFENMTQGVIRRDGEGRIVAVNPAAERILGVTFDEIEGQALTDLNWETVREDGSELPLEDHPATVALRTGRPVRDVVMGIRDERRNAVTWMSVDALPEFRDGETTSSHVFTTFTDITARKAAEDALAASERFLDSVIEHSPISMWISDEHGTLIRLNQACRDLLHVTDEQAVGKYNLFHDNVVEQQGLLPGIRRVFEAGETRRNTIRYNTGDLQDFELEAAALIIEVTISPVIDADGRVVNAIVQNVDVTERERALQSLRDSERRLSALFLTSPTGIYVTRFEDGTLIDVNEAFAALFGVDRAEAIGRTTVEIGMFPDREDRQRVIHSPHAPGLWRDNEIVIRTKQGERRTALISAAKVELAGEQCLVGTITDITQRKAVEDELYSLAQELEKRVEERTAELRESNAQLESFSYSVSHDLRAPLRHISGYAGMLAADYGDVLDQRGQRRIASLTKSVREMGILIDELLEFSRAGRVALNVTRVNMLELVEEVRELLQSECEGRDIEWIVGDLPGVQGDRSMLRQVWANLLGNAVKYTRPREHAVITIAARETAAEFEFTVSDNGVGFEMQYADKLFGVFQRLQADPRFEGVGIGLANVRRIIARHGGRTWGHGALDAGATFGFSLPKESGS